MRMYRLGDDINAEGWPFLRAPHAYLSDGTPLTERGAEGRIIPSREALRSVKKICSGGRLALADRHKDIAALARALDKGDLVLAPILLLQLQIDPAPTLAKFNPWHKPPGPGGGQFTSGPEGGSEGSAPNADARSALPPRFEQTAMSLNVGVTSTYVPGINGADVDAAYYLVMEAVHKAITKVTRPDFMPGMNGYGQALDTAVANELLRYEYLNIHTQQIYLGRAYVEGVIRPAGSSVPDVVYGPVGDPLLVFEIKSGRSAQNINAADIVMQKARTLANMPGHPLYEYIQVYPK